MTFCTAVGSLIWWRNVLARGGPNLVLAALTSIVNRIALRLAQHIDSDLVAVLAIRERMISIGPDHTLLAQLRVALVVAPDGPPSRLVQLADPMVRTDQLISRRAA